jgi:hypothetical protein
MMVSNPGRKNRFGRPCPRKHIGTAGCGHEIPPGQPEVGKKLLGNFGADAKSGRGKKGQDPCWRGPVLFFSGRSYNAGGDCQRDPARGARPPDPKELHMRAFLLAFALGLGVLLFPAPSQAQVFRYRSVYAYPSYYYPSYYYSSYYPAYSTYYPSYTSSYYYPTYATYYPPAPYVSAYTPTYYGTSYRASYPSYPTYAAYYTPSYYASAPAVSYYYTPRYWCP